MTSTNRRLATGLIALTLLGCGQDAQPQPHIDPEDTPPTPAPRIDITPAALDFGNVTAGDEATAVLTVSNVGQAPLTLDQSLLNGSQDFMPLIDGRDPQRQPEVLADPDGDGEPGLSPGATFEITVRYAPDAVGPDQGTLAIFSNDPNRPEAIVELSGNGVTACIALEPNALQFRGPLGVADVEMLTILSCGGAPLVVESIYLSDDSDPAFALVDGLPDLPVEPSTDDEDGLGIRVEFTPQEERAHAGTIIIISNATAEPSKTVRLSGEGAPNLCPTAISTPSEFTAVPLDVITLDGSSSIDPDGPDGQPVEYEWVLISAPAGSTTQPYERFFNNQQPANGGEQDDRTTPTAKLFIDVQGTFELELRVRDALGLGSVECETSARVTIRVEHPEAIRVELTWETPGDPDPTDARGADLDLHLLHPNADSWFSTPYDCHFDNPNPDWGQLENPADDPALDVDAAAGGPENILLYLPENTDVLGAPYVVGVHAQSQIDPQTGVDLGRSVATLRIYIDGELAWDFTDDGNPGSREMLGAGHFWDAAAIEWPSGRITTRNQYSERRP